MGKTIKNQSHRKLFENIRDLLHEARNAVQTELDALPLVDLYSQRGGEKVL